MNLSVYGITPETTFIFFAIGILCGIIWQSSLAPIETIKRISSLRIIAFILLISTAVIGSYLLIGYVLTSFVYSALGIGLITEFIFSKIREVVLFFLTRLKQSTKQHINSNSATLHTLPEEM